MKIRSLTESPDYMVLLNEETGNAYSHYFDKEPPEKVYDELCEAHRNRPYGRKGQSQGFCLQIGWDHKE